MVIWFCCWLPLPLVMVMMMTGVWPGHKGEWFGRFVSAKVLTPLLVCKCDPVWWWIARKVALARMDGGRAGIPKWYWFTRCDFNVLPLSLFPFHSRLSLCSSVCLAVCRCVPAQCYLRRTTWVAHYHSECVMWDLRYFAGEEVDRKYRCMRNEARSTLRKWWEIPLEASDGDMRSMTRTDWDTKPIHVWWIWALPGARYLWLKFIVMPLRNPFPMCDASLLPELWCCYEMCCPTFYPILARIGNLYRSPRFCVHDHPLIYYVA